MITLLVAFGRKMADCSAPASTIGQWSTAAARLTRFGADPRGVLFPIGKPRPEPSQIILLAPCQRALVNAHLQGTFIRLLLVECHPLCFDLFLVESRCSYTESAK